MELEASSKADAERKAIHSNMEVVRVEQTSEVDPHNATLPGRPAYTSSMATHGAGAEGHRKQTKQGRPSSPMFRFFLVLLFCASVATLIYYYWDKIKQHVPGMN
jgi:hypothetical protein